MSLVAWYRLLFQTWNNLEHRRRSRPLRYRSVPCAEALEVRCLLSAPTAPVDINSTANGVVENAANGTVVNLTAHSTDPAGGAVRYSLNDGGAGGRFAINPATGVVTVANGSLLNFETAQSHQFTVVARDASLLTSAATTFTIPVTNAAPTAPTDINGANNVVDRNVANGTPVGITARTTDPAGGEVRYSLTNLAGGLFAINPMTGVVTVASSLVNAASSQTITVVASDGKLNSASANFSISVTGSLPTLSINNKTVTEGTGSTVYANFTVTLSAASGQPVTVVASTQSNTATANGVDYTGTGQTLTFVPGETSKQFSVPITGDTLDEADEKFFVNLTFPTNATLLDGQGEATIIDNDLTPTLSINDPPAVSESAGTVTFNVNLSAASGQTVTVMATTADGSAWAGAGDYVSRTLVPLTFAPGVTSQPFVVTVLNDTMDEAAEKFGVNLSGVSSTATISKPQGLATITDDDPPPTLSINNVTVTEGTGSTVYANFTVTLSAPSGQTVMVTGGTQAASATANGVDYTGTGQTLTFQPGQTVKQFSVPITGDTLPEPDERFYVNLSSPSNATISNGQGQGIGTIHDDELVDLRGEKLQVVGNDEVHTTFKAWGDTIFVEAQNFNAGTSPSGAFLVEWYLSRNQSGSADDIRLTRVLDNGGTSTSYEHAGLGFNDAGYEKSYFVTLRLPTSRPSGWGGEDFFVVMKTDAGDHNFEREPGETNNFGSLGLGVDVDKIRVTEPFIDLQGSYLNAPISVGWGHVINVVSRIANVGNQDTGSFNVEWYLSRDRYGSLADDKLLFLDGGGSSVLHAGIDADSYDNFDITPSLQLPAALPSGWTGSDFFIVMRTDANNAVVESSAGELNNFGQIGVVADYDPIRIQVESFPLDLHSRPGAPKRIYLDFNGHTTQDPNWNNGLPFYQPAYNFEGNAESFSTEELKRMKLIWARVAEDFLPFDVDVTTRDPGDAALRNTGYGENQWGTRVVIGGNSQASLGRDTEWGWARGRFSDSLDTPVFVYSEKFGAGEQRTANIISHEVGHTLGLDHTGTNPRATNEYYGGHQAAAAWWVPIMGDANDETRPLLSQWSQGEFANAYNQPGQFANANNKEDQLLRIVTENGFSYRPVDRGINRITASSLNVHPLNPADGTVLTGDGIIEQNTNADWFQFTTTVAGNVSFTIRPFRLDPSSTGANPGDYGAANLDIKVTLSDAANTFVLDVNPANTLDASISRNVPAGKYFLTIQGAGSGDPATNGYSNYGSLGYYTIDGTVSYGARSSGASGAAPTASAPSTSTTTATTQPQTAGAAAATSGAFEGADFLIATDSFFRSAPTALVPERAGVELASLWRPGWGSPVDEASLDAVWSDWSDWLFQALDSVPTTERSTTGPRRIRPIC